MDSLLKSHSFHFANLQKTVLSMGRKNFSGFHNQSASCKDTEVGAARA